MPLTDTTLTPYQPPPLPITPQVQPPSPALQDPTLACPWSRVRIPGCPRYLARHNTVKALRLPTKTNTKIPTQECKIEPLLWCKRAIVEVSRPWWRIVESVRHKTAQWCLWIIQDQVFVGNLPNEYQTPVPAASLPQLYLFHLTSSSIPYTN